MEAVPLTDPFGRTIRYLRVSVTDRCDLRCVYCMSPDMTFLPKAEVLTLEEIDRLCTAFVRRGVEKLRITGGEPLVRRDVLSLFQSLGRHLATGALRELTLTTNGTQLERFAEPLRAAGVRRVNVSVDTLDPDRFRRLTRFGRLDQVLRGVAAAKAAGLAVKINAVALKGETEDELFDLVAWCGREGFDLTFIEVMPMGDIESASRLDQFWSLRDLRRRLEDRFTVIDTPERTGGPARYARLAETGQRLGFITPLSHNFCESCNRVRLSCTGQLHTCLGQEGASDLRAVLRGGAGDAALDAAIAAAIRLKPRGHDFDYARGVAGRISRHMSHTGG
jgi:cyclic pyranopterin phosphate synthase